MSEKLRDMTCLGKGQVFEAYQPGLNSNELIVGSTGCGKTFSVAIPRILHTFESSLVVPVVKRSLYEQLSGLLKDRGYEVWDLNLANPKLSSIGYDPMDMVKTDSDVISLARCIVGDQATRSVLGEMDSYWGEATISAVGALIGLARYKAKKSGKSAGFADVLKLFGRLEMGFGGATATSNIDREFDEMAFDEKGSQAPKLWKTMRCNSPRTAACVYSMVSNALDKFMTGDMDGIFKSKKKVKISELGNRKIALFVTTHGTSLVCKKTADLLYSDIFSGLFKEAERNGGSLENHVHIVCDDFACGTRLPKFADHVSVFREAKISATILVQSLSQLSGLYGPYEASTIENNCDSLVFMGSLDIETCRAFAARLNMPLGEVLSMPLGKVVVVRRGSKPVITDRYPVFEDEYYPSYHERT